MRRDRRWAVGLVLLALLIGAMSLCDGFLRGPGAAYVLLPFPIVGVVAAFAFGVRRREFKQSWLERLAFGACTATVFFVLMYVPLWLWWGWLEWRVRGLPIPPNVTSSRLSTGGVPFDGRSDCLVWFEKSMTEAEIDALPRPGEEWRAALEDYRFGVIEEVVAYYQDHLTSNGWKPVPGATSALTARLRPKRVLAFSRDGERLTISVLPNTHAVEFLLEPGDALPPFGEIWIPGPPWSRRPAPVAPVQQSGQS